MKTKKYLIGSLVLTIFYLILCYAQFGMAPSISHYAIDWRDTSMQYMPFVWVTSILVMIGVYCFDAGKYGWMLFTSILVLTGIGYFTGYNPEFMNNKVENFIHVACVYISIPLALTYIIISSKSKGLSILLTITFLIFTVLMLTFEVKNHTTYIEEYCFAVIYFYLIYRDDLNIIKSE